MFNYYEIFKDVHVHSKHLSNLIYGSFEESIHYYYSFYEKNALASKSLAFSTLF